MMRRVKKEMLNTEQIQAIDKCVDQKGFSVFNISSYSSVASKLGEWMLSMKQVVRAHVSRRSHHFTTTNSTPRLSHDFCATNMNLSSRNLGKQSLYRQSRETLDSIEDEMAENSQFDFLTGVNYKTKPMISQTPKPKNGFQYQLKTEQPFSTSPVRNRHALPPIMSPVKMKKIR